MANKDKQSPGSGHSEQGIRKLKRPSTDKFAEMAQREDVRALVDGDWLKKSRDDVPPGNRRMPQNPLVNLKPPKRTGQGRKDSTQPRRRSDD